MWATIPAKETKCLTVVRIGKFSNDVPSSYVCSVHREIKQLKSENLCAKNKHRLSQENQLHKANQLETSSTINLCLESVVLSRKFGVSTRITLNNI